MSITLGTAADYAALAGSYVNNTGASVLTGDVGVSPGGAAGAPFVTGFVTSTPPGLGTYTGTLNINNAAATQALADAAAAFNAITATATTAELSASSYSTITGQILTSRVYSVGTDMTINGNLILRGGASDGFVFKIGGALTAAPSSSITFDGPVNQANIFWQVREGAVTLGTNSSFQGTIIARDGSITCNSGASSTSGLIARFESVILNTNRVSNSAVCYVKGTKILTSTGYKNIEDIVLGDEVCVYGDITDDDKLIINTSNGETTRKVIFGGYFTRSHLNVESKPIVFKAGSLGENVPFEDVAVSPGHGIILHDLLISAEQLVNCDTIYQSDDYEEVTYYHIELESHSIINAGGLFGESLAACQDKFTPI